MPKAKSIRSKPRLARGVAAFLLTFGIIYYITIFYPEFPPALFLLGNVAVTYLALVNGLIYGVVALLIVSEFYRSR